MSNYVQSAYETPFAPLVPPSHPAYALNDEFAQARVPAPGQPGYVALASTWLTFDPGNRIAIAAVDPVRQMAYLQSTTSDKEWFGKVQPLPLPTVNGQAVQIALYQRTTVGFITEINSVEGWRCGLIIGRDLQGGAAATSDLIAIAQHHQRIDGVHQAQVQAATFATYAGLAVPLGASLQPANLFRARIRQLRNAGPTYDITIELDTSADGIGWVPVGRVELLAQANPYRHAGFAARGVATAFGSYTDFFRVGAQSITDVTTTTGGSQQLGAV